MEIAAVIVVVAILYAIVKAIIANIGVILLFVGAIGALYALSRTLNTERGRKAMGIAALVAAVALGSCLSTAALGAIDVGLAWYFDHDALRLALLLGSGHDAVWLAWATWVFYGAVLGAAFGASVGLWRANHKAWSAVVALLVSGAPFAIVPTASAIRDPMTGLCREACTHVAPLRRAPAVLDAQAAIGRKRAEIEALDQRHFEDTDRLKRDLAKQLRLHERAAASVRAESEASAKAVDADYGRAVAELQGELHALREAAAGMEARRDLPPTKPELETCVARCLGRSPSEKQVECARDAVSLEQLGYCGMTWE